MSASAGVDPTRSGPGSGGVQAALFDLGNVLVDWNPRYLYAKMFADQAEMERFLSEVCTMAWHGAHDRGVAMAENRIALTAAHPHYAEAIKAWDTRWAEMFAGPIPGAAALVERLHAGGTPLYALTNLPAEKKSHIIETFSFMRLFRDVVVSGEEGVMKPDPRIYEITARRIGAPPSSVVFFDDRQDNVDAARAFGFDAVLYTTPEAMADALAARGLLAESLT